MKLASESMARISVLGGDWNGHAVTGGAELEVLRETSSAGATLSEFEAVVRKAIASRPYVHYDVETGCVMFVSEDDAERCGLDVRKLSMPAPRILEQWYAEFVGSSRK